jgi:hypothetical protein
VAEGKITADDADKLIDALGEEPSSNATNDKPVSEPPGTPKHLHIQVTGAKNGENVNIKIPIFLLKAGLKLGGIMPGKAHAKLTTHLGDLGLDMDKLDAGQVDQFIKALMEGQIKIRSDKEVVKIYCE